MLSRGGLSAASGSLPVPWRAVQVLNSALQDPVLTASVSHFTGPSGGGRKLRRHIRMTTGPHPGTTGPDLWEWDLGVCRVKSSRPDDSNMVAWTPRVKKTGLEDVRTSRPGRKVSPSWLGNQEEEHQG